MPKKEKGKRVKLDDPFLQQQIYDKIALTGQDQLAYDGICVKSTFYNYIRSNPKFRKYIEEARQEFRQSLWKERPDLKRLAIEGLEKSLRSFEQTYEKIYYIIEENPATGKSERKQVKAEVTKVTRLPKRWAIELVLGLRKDVKDDNDNEPPFDEVVYLQ